MEKYLAKATSLNGEWRYVIMDRETGEIVDDAQGYGYRTAQKAYAAWGVKHRDKSKDKEKAELERVMANWLREHQEFVFAMEEKAFEVSNGIGDPDAKFDARLFRRMLKEAGFEELPFTAGQLHRYWEKGPVYSKGSRRKKGK